MLTEDGLSCAGPGQNPGDAGRGRGRCGLGRWSRCWQVQGEASGQLPCRTAGVSAFQSHTGFQTGRPQRRPRGGSWARGATSGVPSGSTQASVSLASGCWAGRGPVPSDLRLGRSQPCGQFPSSLVGTALADTRNSPGTQTAKGAPLSPWCMKPLFVFPPLPTRGEEPERLFYSVLIQLPGD